MRVVNIHKIRHCVSAYQAGLLTTAVVLLSVALILVPLFKQAVHSFGSKSDQLVYCYLDPFPGSPDPQFVGNNSKAVWQHMQQIESSPREQQQDALVLDCWITALDLLYYVMTVTCRPRALGQLAKSPSNSRLDLTRWTPAGPVPQGGWASINVSQLQLVVEYAAASHQVLADGDTLAPTQVGLQLSERGDPYDRSVVNYPSTKLSFVLDMTAYLIANNATDDLAAPSLPQVPFYAVFAGNYLPQYDVQGLECFLNENQRSVMIQGYIAIDSLSAHLLIGLSVVMWLLAAGAFAVSLRWVVAPESVRTPHDLLSFNGALLFALPTMRQLWPAAPPGSTKLDALCIWPQLLLVSFGILLVLGKNLCTVRSESKEVHVAADRNTGDCCYTFT